MSGQEQEQPGRRPLLPAPVGPLASSVIVSRFGEAIEETARSFELVGTPEAEAAAVQLRQALDAMRESARLRNRARNLQGARKGACGGTAEPARGADGQASVSTPWTHLTVAQVAERFDVSGSFVRRLCRTGALSATRGRSGWEIDGESVADMETLRRVG